MNAVGQPYVWKTHDDRVRLAAQRYPTYTPVGQFRPTTTSGWLTLLALAVPFVAAGVGGTMGAVRPVAGHPDRLESAAMGAGLGFMLGSVPSVALSMVAYTLEGKSA